MKVFWKVYNIWATLIGAVLGTIGFVFTLIGVGLLFVGLFTAGQVESWKDFRDWAGKLDKTAENN